MAVAAYYNEHDAQAAAWLRELIKCGHIAPGEVDERDIRDVAPADLVGFCQCHFFAGIGVWSYALRRAGWPDDRPVWTGSCPCQPFSSAGKGAGFADERHLWPDWFWLIRQCRPECLFGEQVSGKDGLAWLDAVQADLESEAYACGALDLCAPSVGAPHIRQRFYWVAHTHSERRQQERGSASRHEGAHGRRAKGAHQSQSCGETGDLVHADLRGLEGSDAHLPARRPQSAAAHTHRPGEAGHLGHTESERLSDQLARGLPSQVPAEPPGPTNGFWHGAAWIWCRDERWRPVEPGTFPLADRAPARVGRLRGYGNAIVAPLAQEFIASYLQLEGAGK